jgi:hypothetical protein
MGRHGFGHADRRIAAAALRSFQTFGLETLMIKKRIGPMIAMAALLFTSAAAQAAITVYTTQASFLAAVSAPATDSFDSLASGFITGLSARSVGSYKYSVSAPDGLFPTATGSDVVLAPNRPTDTLTFSAFTGGVSAVGGLFFNTDFNGSLLTGQGITIVATDASGSTSRTIAQPVGTSFLGFVSTSGVISSLTVAAGQDAGLNYFPSVNNLTLAVAAVPEPESLLLWAAGLCAIATVARRRQH